MGEHWVATLALVERMRTDVGRRNLEILLLLNTVKGYLLRIRTLEPIPEMSNNLEPIPDLRNNLEPIPDMRNIPQIWNF